MSPRSFYCSQATPECIEVIRAFTIEVQTNVQAKNRYIGYLAILDRIQRQSCPTISFLKSMDAFIKEFLSVVCQFREPPQQMSKRWIHFFGKELIEQDTKETQESYCNYTLASFVHAFDTFYPLRTKHRQAIYQYIRDLQYNNTVCVFSTVAFDDYLTLCYPTSKAKKYLLYFIDAFVSTIYDHVHNKASEAIENMLYQLQYCKQTNKQTSSIVASSEKLLEESTWGCNKDIDHVHGKDCFVTPYTLQCLLLHRKYTFAPDEKIRKAKLVLMEQIGEEVELYQNMYEEYIQCVEYNSERFTLFVPPQDTNNEEEINPLRIHRFAESNLRSCRFYSSKCLEIVLQSNAFRTIYEQRFQYFFY